MSVLMVPHPKMDRKESREATFVVSDLTMFNPSQVGLPGYNYLPASHLIFDMDGLLLNTQEIYSRVGGELLARHGKTSDQGLRMKVVGRRMEEAAELIVQHYGLPYTAQQYIDIFQDEANQVDQASIMIFTFIILQSFQLFPACDLLPGVERLIRHLHHHNVPIAVATSSSR